MKISEEQFAGAAHAVSTSVLDAFENFGLDRDDAANVAGAAMVEVIARQIGPAQAVERLRDIADRCEAQLLSS
ncbi:hypothetical protein [Aurantiacibacter sp. MUD61]|uniref:hypothetical protein n=1 Tax=Aurantiacibacter sp. MUD61 TaxID=3009083 RepID=UPI0022F085FB|nr:hypothetical protein [Aurantiacibacter sp. MUD61]